MHITLVKKIKADGIPCRKCAEVEQRLISAGLMGRIDEVAIADERDPNSRGMQLAARHSIAVAPFFIVRDDAGAERVYTVYFKFVKEVLGDKVSDHDEAKELLDQNSAIDYL
jgi:hypothetical protein